MEKKLQKNSKIKVVIGLPGFGIGGIERHVLKQLHFFNRDTFHIQLITLFNSRFSLEQVASLYTQIPAWVTVHKLDFKKVFDISELWRLFKLLLKIKPDVVMTSMFSANAVFRVLKPFVGYVSIAREHNTYTDRKIYHRLVDKLLSFCTYRIVAVSKGVADFIFANSWVSRKKIEVIYNSVDIQEIESFRKKHKDSVDVLKKSLGFTSEERVVLHVGRLKKQKNQKMLIDAFDVFAQSNPGHTLAIVGGGDEEISLRQYALEKKTGNKIIFFGVRDDVYGFYMVSDFFVLTSIIEGFAIVGIEAMAFGLPVVSTRVAGPDEYVKDGYNGYLVDTTLAAVEKMEMISQQLLVEQERMRVNCLQTAKEFSIQENVRKYEELFRKALKKYDD